MVNDRGGWHNVVLVAKTLVLRAARRRRRRRRNRVIGTPFIV